MGSLCLSAKMVKDFLNKLQKVELEQEDDHDDDDYPLTDPKTSQRQTPAPRNTFFDRVSKSQQSVHRKPIRPSALMLNQRSDCHKHNIKLKTRSSKTHNDTLMCLLDRKKTPYYVKKERLSQDSQKLLPTQIQAFWNAFLLFDHQETGTISAVELHSTLTHVGLHVTLEDLQAIIDENDDNGNGELDFEEYLNLMTDPHVFENILHRKTSSEARRDTVNTSGRASRKSPPRHSKHSAGRVTRPNTFHTPNKPDLKDCIMYEVMNEFFNANSLSEEQEHEIVKYYAKLQKKATNKQIQHHAAHVVHHYADGARSVGLTDKEIECQIQCIKEKQKHETNAMKRNSPYAKPMQMIPRIQQNKEYRKKYKIMSKNNAEETLAIWRGTPIVNYRVNLPRITVQDEKTFENLKKIRSKVYKVNNDYRVQLSSVQRRNSENLWSNLRHKHIPNERLKDILKEVYGAYTTHVRLQPLNYKPKQIAYSVHDFAAVFSSDDDSSDDDSEYEDFERSRNVIRT